MPNAERWITSKGDIKITAKDNVEGELAGYTYKVYDKNNIEQIGKGSNNKIIPIETSIPIETDGEWKISIKAVDKAGNESVEKIVNVLKDETPPSVDTPEVSNITARGFTITVSAGDNISQLAKYVYNIGGNSYEGDTTGIYEVSGLAPNTNYSVTVTVYNGAGISSTSNNKPVKTGIGLQAPNIIPSGSTQNGYYKELITISLSEKVAGTGATKIKYKLNGGQEQTINGTSGSFTITQDGNYSIEAWTEDNENHKSTSSNASVSKDTTRTNSNTKHRRTNGRHNTSNSKCRR